MPVTLSADAAILDGSISPNDISSKGTITGTSDLFATPPTQVPQQADSTSSFASSHLATGRITHAEHATFEKLYDAEHHTAVTVGETIAVKYQMSRRGTEAVSQVFNIPELLDLIPQKLDYKHLLLRARLTCRGFKNMTESSPVILQRKNYFALDFTSHPASFNVKPRLLHFIKAEGNNGIRASFRITSSSSFEQLRASPEYQQLRVCNDPLLPIIVMTERNWGGRPMEIRFCIFSADLPERQDVTFGHLFDRVAKPIIRIDDGSILRMELVLHRRSNNLLEDW